MNGQGVSIECLASHKALQNGFNCSFIEFIFVPDFVTACICAVTAVFRVLTCEVLQLLYYLLLA